MPVSIARLSPEAMRQAFQALDRYQAGAAGVPDDEKTRAKAVRWQRDSGSGSATDPFAAETAHPAGPAISAPSLPPSQSTSCDTPIVFSVAAGNAIRLAPANPRRKSIRVRLIARRGTIRLANATGLRFGLGDGAGDYVVMEFAGPVNVVNSALDGLRFTPSRGFIGLASLRITAQDPSGRLTRDPIVDASVEIEVAGDTV
jgi:hypothetical protein